MSQNDAKSKQNTQSTSTLIMDGDVTGAVTTLTVAKLQNNSIKTGTPSDANLFTWSTANTDWEPLNVASTSETVAGTVTIPGAVPYTLVSTDTTVYYPTTYNLFLPASTTTGRIVFAHGPVTFRPFTGTTINGLTILASSISRLIICYNGTDWAVLK